MTAEESARTVPEKSSIRWLFIVLSAIGLATFIHGALSPHPERAWQAYLVNFLLFSAVAQGALVFSALMHTTGARWSGPLASLAEAFSAFFPVSLVLFLILFIGREHVRMKVKPEVSQVTGFVTLEEGAQYPIISTRNAETTVTVRDGETLIVGGLMSTSTIESKTQVPLIGDIPLLGRLFSSTKTTDVKSELVFFITPRILRARTGGEMRVIKPPELKKRTDGE